MITGIVLIAVAIVVLFFVFNSRSKSASSDFVDTLSSSGPVIEQSRYDFFLEKYNKAEKKVIESADREIRNVQTQIEATSDPTKKMFLQSFVDHFKYDKLYRLLIYSKYSDEDLIDEIDSLFTKTAEKVVANQKCDYLSFLDWFGYNQGLDKYNHIMHQLSECGIIDKNFEETDEKICVRNMSELNKILRKVNGRSLLSKDDKLKLNEYFKQRRQELIGEHELYSVLSTEIPESYMNVVTAYDALASSKSKWEIVSSKANTEAKSYASTIVDKKDAYGIYKKFFNFLKPGKEVLAPFFEFKRGGMCFYIYPEFVIASRSATNFDVIKIRDFNVNFRKENFVETNNYLIPKDAKLVRYTYKYVNKNGERDYRYSDNPRYAVYEYGDITFLPYELTMQFSNSEYAENFYKKVQIFRNGGKEPVDSTFGASESYFNKAYDITLPVCNFYDKIKNNGRIMNVVDKLLPDITGNTEDKFRLLFMIDVLKCYNKLGHDATNISTKEGLPLIILESHVLSNVDLDYKKIQSDNIVRAIEAANSYNKTVIGLAHPKEDFFHLKEIFNACGLHNLVADYFSLLYRLFSVIAKADDTVTPEESKWLEQIMSYSQTSRTYENETYALKGNVVEWKMLDDKQQNIDKQEPQNVTQSNPIEELQSLIGLSEVKEEVSALANFVKIQQEREKKGMKAVGLSYHCVFTGNPGTGKTTVARILAEIYRDLGILKKGHLVETDRSGLVAEYVGQTAVKTNKIIDSALDGVLFIDEAYSLVQGGGNDYGQEAISTLLKRMEDDRSRLIVVLAGYSEDMKRFIDSNPGLQSRFNRYIHFEDYTADELKQIFLLNVDKNQYLLEPEGEELLSKILNFAVEHKDKNFGNGRYVRNLFEKTIQKQAIRLSCQPNITAEELSKLKAEDLPTNK